MYPFHFLHLLYPDLLTQNLFHITDQTQVFNSAQRDPEQHLSLKLPDEHSIASRQNLPLARRDQRKRKSTKIGHLNNKNEYQLTFLDSSPHKTPTVIVEISNNQRKLNVKAVMLSVNLRLRSGLLTDFRQTNSHVIIK